MSNKQQAFQLLCEAYDQLEKAGIPEEFFQLGASVAQTRRGTFFGSFGGDSGCFIEIQMSNDNFAPVRLMFGMRRHNQSWWSKIKTIFWETWAIFRGHDTEHEMRLKPDDIARLKDLLRVLR